MCSRAAHAANADMLINVHCLQPLAEVPLDEAGDELQKGWQFVKDRAGKLDSMATHALDEAGAAIQVPADTLAPSHRITAD